MLPSGAGSPGGLTRAVSARSAGLPGYQVVGWVHVKQVYELAVLKKKHDPALANDSEEGIARSIIGTAKSCGIEVYR